jgi:glycosidase
MGSRRRALVVAMVLGVVAASTAPAEARDVVGAGAGPAAGARGGPDRPDRPGRPDRPVADRDLVGEPVRQGFDDEVLYFLVPDRFENGRRSNNCGAYQGRCVAGDTQENVLTHGYLPSDKGYYHGGDIEGLRRKLPYLEELGVTTIWVGPIFRNNPVQEDSTNLYGHSSAYHGYWILDFLQVDPHLGTDRDFARLVDDAHDRDIEVFMDIVTNHTADVIQLLGNAGYRDKAAFPYRDADGQEFDDSQLAYEGQDDDAFPPIDPATSFPYVPTVPAGMEDAKNPAWLNDPSLYHNRGDSTFAGESSLYGDFFGLDDLWTERREVVEGMVDIYAHWIEEFGVDGFRIDTTKHVDMEFWRVFGPEILDVARERGIEDFFAFGEVFDQQFGPQFLSEFSTTEPLQGTIDFAFQVAARGFASQGGATANLEDFFAKDDYYTDLDSSAQDQPTFLGNHDMGRIGHFLQRVDQPGAGDAELLARHRLAHALMFFSRGQPVVYYGDEQGFTGDGGDKDAREDMFANRVAVYEDNDLIGTDATTSDDNFDTDHPLYRSIRRYADLHHDNRALQTGAQIHRYSSDGPGIYAFSRIDRNRSPGRRREYVVALNNSESAATAHVPTYSRSRARYDLLSSSPGLARGPAGRVASRLVTRADGGLDITVPPLGYAIYEASSPVPRSSSAPAIEITGLTDGGTAVLGTHSWDGHDILDRVEVAAALDRAKYAEVTFAVREGDGDWTPIGTDDNPPYRVFYDASHLRGPDGRSDGTRLSFRAIVNDMSGHLAADQVEDVGVDFARPPEAVPGHAVIHYSRDDGAYDGWGLHLWGDGLDPADVTDWTAPKPFVGEDEYGRFGYARLTDVAEPVNLIVHSGDTKDPPEAPDRAFDPRATPEVWLRSGDLTVYGSQAEAQGHATVHYACPVAGCAGVTLDASGASGPLASGVPPDAVDGDGAVFRVQPGAAGDLAAPVTVTVRQGGTVDVDAVTFTPTETPSAWLQPGSQVVHPSRGAAEGFATIHYRRPAGDYGDPSSSDADDFWGLHVWTGAAAETPWTAPLQPVGQDGFGLVFRIDLAPGATRLDYILHRGDTKDPGPDQSLDLVATGHEVWQLQAADPDNPHLIPTRAP